MNQALGSLRWTWLLRDLACTPSENSKREKQLEQIEAEHRNLNREPKQVGAQLS
jgi:hypothetical protein